MDHRSLLALVAAVSFAACGAGPSPPTGPAQPAPQQIAGTEPPLEDRLGSVLMVAVGPDEAVHFCTERALAKLVPDARR